MDEVVEPPGRPESDEVQAQATASSTNKEPRRLFLIEDDFALRANLAELLMQHGYEVVCAADGAEALRRLEHEPHLAGILLDIVLPHLDGVAFRRVQLRSSGFLGIPTIAMTSMKDLSRLDGLNFSKIINKPIDFDGLLHALDEICGDDKQAGHGGPQPASPNPTE